MAKNKLIILFAAGLGTGLFFGFLLGQNTVLNREVNPDAFAVYDSRIFSLMIDYGDGKIETFHGIQFEPQEKLFIALERTLKGKGINFVSEDYKDLGKLVLEIGNRKNGADNKYWQYWVDNRHADVGADQYVLKSGDVVEWKFIAFSGE